MTSSQQSRLGTVPEEGCKAPVKVVATSPITLVGEQTINSVALVSGDRVLVTSQTDAAANGIYNVNTSAWTRAKDWNKANDVVPGILIPASNPTKLYVLGEFTGSYVAGTTPLYFQLQTADPASYTGEKQYENQQGSDASGTIFTLQNMSYTVAVHDLEIFLNGVRLLIDDQYTELSPTTVQVTESFSSTDEFVFLSDLVMPLGTSTTAAISHTESGTTYNLAEYLRTSKNPVSVSDSFTSMVASTDTFATIRMTSGYYSDNPGWGVGVYVKTTTTGVAGVTDSGGYFYDTEGYKWELVHDGNVRISQFGAKVDNDNFDNRTSIQACIDFCTSSGANFVVDPIEQTWDPTLNGGSGGYVNRYFGVGSFHPDYVEGCCLVFEEPRNFFIFGNTSRVSSIRYYGVTAGQCVVKLGSVNTTDWGYVVDGLGVSATADETDQAGCVLDYAVYGRNTTGLARCTFRNCTFSGGLLRAAEFHGYMIDFQQVEVKYGQAGGLRLDGPSNLADGSDPVTTSITLQNVWARQCGGTGIRFRNQAWYVNLISCGVDGAGPSTATSINRPEYAYEFGNVRGMTMMSCGAEEVDRFMRLVSCDSVNIIGPKGTGWGKTDGTVADYALEITGNGTSVNISGWPKGTAVTTGVAPTKKYNYVLGVTKSDGAMGNLLVQIMDNGINYLETYYVANSGTFTIPIVWPNDTADGAHRAQRKTGNTTWPNKDVIISPADGQWGTDGCLRKVINITGEATATTHQILMHYGGNNATTYVVSVTLSSQAGGTAAKWDGVANVTGSGKNITYFTKTSGNSGATPTLAWNGDALEYNASVNYFESIIEVIAYSNNTVVSAEFLL